MRRILGFTSPLRGSLKPPGGRDVFYDNCVYLLKSMFIFLLCMHWTDEWFVYLFFKIELPFLARTLVKEAL
jgi:hypothetical protein